MCIYIDRQVLYAEEKRNGLLYDEISTNVTDFYAIQCC